MARTPSASTLSSAPTKAADLSPTPCERSVPPSKSLLQTKHTVLLACAATRAPRAPYSLQTSDASATSLFCHDNKAMPATYRVYQTATPRVYSDTTTRARLDHNSDWVVRSMDDEKDFGVELYRKSYVEAVDNKWLADYRIIAVGVNGADVYEVANRLAQDTESKGRNRLTTPHFLRGLAFALAMGGAAQSEENGSVPIKSCIAFMNTVDKSKNMAKDLQEPFVKKWLQDWLTEHSNERQAADYFLEHLDATSNVSQRENAKRRLAAATPARPHGIINVGIFGEGTDSPSLSAVAFLEPRKSPIDVIQAVGRAMRTAPDKSVGYIICPIVFPPNADAESWLSNSSPEEGWQELGQGLSIIWKSIRLGV